MLKVYRYIHKILKFCSFEVTNFQEFGKFYDIKFGDIRSSEDYKRFWKDSDFENILRFKQFSLNAL